jgi:hypothetical protein
MNEEGSVGADAPPPPLLLAGSAIDPPSPFPRRYVSEAEGDVIFNTSCNVLNTTCFSSSVILRVEK